MLNTVGLKLLRLAAWANAPAIALYNRMEWDEVDEPGVPNWLKGPMEMRKELG